MRTGVIFDVDGTLWDSCEQVVDSWNVVFNRYPNLNVRVDYDVIKGMMGKHMRNIIAELIPGADKEIVEKLAAECCSYEIEYLNRGHSGTFFEGTTDTLKTLKEKYFIGIVSNCQEGYIESVIKCGGLENVIDDYLCAGIAGVPKEDNIRSIIKNNHIEKAFYVGDTATDCKSAKIAGAEFIFASYGFGEVDAGFSIDDIRALPALVEKLTS